MFFKVNPQIFKDYSGIRIGVILAKDITNKVDDKKNIKLLDDVQSYLNKALDKSLLAKHPQILAWHQAFKKFGATPKKHLSSIENLANRIVTGSVIKPINSLVDLYNAISIKYLLPIGGQDLDAINGDIELTIAGGNENPIILLGQKEKKAPQVGEVFYKDEEGAIGRRWNWKEAERTKITPETKNAIFVIEALPPVETEMLQDALNELGQLLKTQCGGEISTTIIDQEHPEITLKKNNKFQQLNVLEKLSDKTWPVYELHKEELSEESKLRIAKVEEMRAEGIDPWPPAKDVPNTCKEVMNQFGTKAEQKSYTIAGRLMSLRWHGKTAFGDIQDTTCKIQMYFKKDEIGDQKFKILKKFIDIGDILWITGPVFRTKMGEITIEVKDFELLSKCLHPLPEKFHGLTDVEKRYRQRYLDLIINPESKEKFIRRSLLVRGMRNFLDNHDFLEVETPMLHPIAGGAIARPFITHHNAYDTDFYLRIAPELYLKRLVIGGFDRVYEINRNFRNEGVSTKHNPEFTMAEFYMANHDYHFVMRFVEDLLRTIMMESCGTTKLLFGEHAIDFGKTFRRISVRDSVLEIGNLKEKDIDPKTIDATLKKYSVSLANKKASQGEKIFALFEELVESKLIQPTFITDFPIEVSPLAKRDPDNLEIAARFELFVAGMEICNGFNELNDPFDQAERFKQQLDAHRSGDDEAHQYDADYIQALEYALPPTVGVGIGVDRLVMLATNTTSIKDVILFPTLKKK